MSAAEGKGCVIKHERVPHPGEGGHLLMSGDNCPRVAGSRGMHRRAGIATFCPPASWHDWLPLGSANFIAPRAAGKLPESKARAQGKTLGWGSTETDDLPTRPNSHISLMSEWQALVFLANHGPSFYSLPKCVSNILYADKQTLWSRLWRAYAITPGVCVYN